MAFNPDEYLAQKVSGATSKPQDSSGSFDPDKYIGEKVVGNTQNLSSSNQAALEHFGNAASMGYLPQLQALAEKPMFAVLNTVNGTQATPDDYVTARDMNAKRLDEEANQHPLAATAGGIGGTLVSAVPLNKAISSVPLIQKLAQAEALPFSGLASKGKALGSRLAASVLGSAAQGSLYNPGETEGEVSPLQLDRRVGGATFNGLLAPTAHLVGEAAPVLGKVGAKVGSAVTGIPAEEIETYAKNSPQIKQMVKEAGGDLSQASDNVRQAFQDAIQATRKGANQTISSAKAAASSEPSVSVQPILEKLQDAEGKVNLYRPEERQQLKDLSKQIQDSAVDGKVSPQQMLDLASFLQQEGKSAFNSKGIFQAGSQAQKGAAAAGSLGAELRDQALPVEKAYDTLQALREIEGTPGAKNLITPGDREASLLAAGSGNNPRSQAILKKLGDLTGQDLLGQAKNLTAARTFLTNAQLLPTDATGKSLTRLVAGPVLGAGAAHVLGVNPEIGAMLGGAATSPIVLRTAIGAARPLVLGADQAITKTPVLLPQLLRQAESQGNSIERRLKK